MRAASVSGWQAEGVEGCFEAAEHRALHLVGGIDESFDDDDAVVDGIDLGMGDKGSAHGFAGHFPQSACLLDVVALDVHVGDVAKLMVGGHVTAGMLAGYVGAHEGVAQGHVGVAAAEDAFGEVGVTVDADVLDGGETIVAGPDEVVADFHFADVGGNVHFAAEHFLHFLVELDVVLVFEACGFAVDFLGGEVADEEGGLFGDEGRELLVGCAFDGHDELGRGVKVALDPYLRFGAVGRGLEQNDVAEEVGDAVVVALGDMADMEDRLVLWEHGNGASEDFAQGPAGVAVPEGVVGYDHDFVRVAGG